MKVPQVCNATRNTLGADAPRFFVDTIVLPLESFYLDYRSPLHLSFLRPRGSVWRPPSSGVLIPLTVAPSTGQSSVFLPRFTFWIDLIVRPTGEDLSTIHVWHSHRLDSLCPRQAFRRNRPAFCLGFFFPARDSILAPPVWYYDWFNVPRSGTDLTTPGDMPLRCV